MEPPTQPTASAGSGARPKQSGSSYKSKERSSRHDGLVRQWFPWCVICEAARLTYFPAASHFFVKNHFFLIMMASRASIASREKMSKNCNFYVRRVVERRLYGNRCAAYSA